jgi:hypothetical protein
MEEPSTYHDDLHSDMKQKVPWWEQGFGEMFEQLSENVKNGGDQLAEQCKHVIDHKVWSVTWLQIHRIALNPLLVHEKD